MGITIGYRGRLADLTRVEDFEDRLVDLALEMGAQVQIWRSWADDHPERLVRGVILGLAPGQESTSLLLSPEGWLIGLVDIQDAEEGHLHEPPWCFVKTQYGPIPGHVALVEMLAALRREFLADLEVSDDGDYWETRDLAELVRRWTFTQRVIDGLAEGLRNYGLTVEAAEDPDILVRHIERVAEHVHRTLRRPAEHPTVEVEDDDFIGGSADPGATETMWDELAKQERRQQERVRRAIHDRLSRGLDEATAFRDAIRDVVPELPDEEDRPRDETWQESVTSLVEEASMDQEVGFGESDDDAFESEPEGRHPLLQEAMALVVRLDSLVRGVDPQSPALAILVQGAGDLMGGLAQALSHGDHDAGDWGLRIVQLKRALRGVAFARGALFPLRSTLGAEPFDELSRTLEQMGTDVVSELGNVRSERRGDES